MNASNLIDLSRLQFAATAMYHFLFVPLTLGPVHTARDHGEHLRHDGPARYGAT